MRLFDIGIIKDRAFSWRWGLSRVHLNVLYGAIGWERRCLYLDFGKLNKLRHRDTKRR